MATFHFFGNYTADLKGVFDELVARGYGVTYDMRGKEDKKPHDHPDFLVESHGLLTVPGSRHIHVQHGVGFFPQIPPESKSYCFLKDYMQFYRFATYSEYQAKAFVDKGFPRERLMILGMPFSIQLLAEEPPAARRNFLESLGLDADRKTVLYAPSWDHGEGRGLFVNWWRDGQEAKRVEELCHLVVRELGCNLMIRLHEKHRYSQDWLAIYRATLDKYGVPACYLRDAVDGFPYFKYSDMLISDLSTVIIYFYVMDKPVVHIGKSPFLKKRSKAGAGGIPLSDRCGYVVEDYQDFLESIRRSMENPTGFAEKRHEVVAKYIAHLGNDCREAIGREFGKL